MAKGKKVKKKAPAKKVSNKLTSQEIYQFEDDTIKRGRKLRAGLESEDDSDDNDDGLGGEDESIDDEGNDVGWDRYV